MGGKEDFVSPFMYLLPCSMRIHAKILTEHFLQLFVKVKTLIAQTVAGEQYHHEKIYILIHMKYICTLLYMQYIYVSYSLPI